MEGGCAVQSPFFFARLSESCRQREQRFRQSFVQDSFKPPEEALQKIKEMQVEGVW